MKKYKNGVIIVVLVILAVAFFAWGAATSTAATWQDTDVLCLPSGHTNLAVHIHPVLSISVDGERETIPANIGIRSSCMAEVHTHDGTGMLHVETATADRINELTLSHFFDVWGKDIERDGYDLTARVNGEAVNDSAGIMFEDRQEIELEYTSATGSESVGTEADSDEGEQTESGDVIDLLQGE